MKQIQSTVEVYRALLNQHHKDLQVYSSASMPGGMNLMETNWCLKDSDFPLFGALTTWESEDEKGLRVNEKSEYWIYAILKKDSNDD